MDFFNNIIKSTSNIINKTTESKEKPANEEENVKAAENVDVGKTSGEEGDVSSPATKKSRPRRSSSGDTSGPDDNVNDDVEDEATGKDDAAGGATAHKAIESAKHFGNFLYSFANKAGQTVSATAKQFKHTVEQTGILADFTKEQQEFIKQHGGNIQVGEVPWSGCDDEANVKEQVLSLSQDKRNFVRSPPTGVQFQFDVESAYPIALALLKEDENLNKMRFEIVPKLVTEETFWRNYFYRISLIKQSTQLSSLANKGGTTSWSSSRSSSAEGPDDPNAMGGDTSPTNADPEFISDSFQSNDKVSAEDFRKGMRQLGMDSKQNTYKEDDQQWEEEVQRDLQEFEVVAGDVVNTIDEAELERELAQLDS